MAGVSFHQVTKRFGPTLAVDRLDLDVDDGEFMVLLGPSGCGKTTALRMIAGLDAVTDGTLLIADRDVTHVEARQRDVAMVFQSYALYPHMTAFANIESPLVARKFAIDGASQPWKMTRAERRTRVEEAAQILGLTDLLARKPGALSGGERQRVALARAIVSRPAVFLMDEPLSNLDAKLRAQTRLELVDLQHRLATTFVYVTHDQVEAMTMATRIAIIVNGRLQQVGTPREVYERPANLFVARFVGSPPMNTLPGRFAVVDGTPCVELGDGRLPLGHHAPALEDGLPVVVARPEHLHVGATGATAEVVAVEWLGHEQHLVCTVGGDRLTLREATGSEPIHAGARVHLDAPPAHLHLFDADDGRHL